MQAKAKGVHFSAVPVFWPVYFDTSLPQFRDVGFPAHICGSRKTGLCREPPHGGRRAPTGDIDPVLTATSVRSEETKLIDHLRTKDVLCGTTHQYRGNVGD